MPKQTQLEKAIAGLDAEIAVLQAAKQRLVTQQATVKKTSVLRDYLTRPPVLTRSKGVGDADA